MNKVYELGYHVLATVSEDKVGAVATELKELLVKFEAEIIADQYPMYMDLAYEMIKDIDNKNKRFKNAYFGWIKFEVAGEKIEEFEEEVKKNGSLLRYILIKTVRENTLAAAKIAAKQMNAKRVERKPEAKVELDKKAVDAKLDEMLEEDKAAEAKPEAGEPKPEAVEATEADDLTKIEGIGPVIAKTLTEAGVATFAQLAEAKSEDVQVMIEGVRGNHDSGTWGEQSALARDGKWDELKELQDKLDGGKE